MVTNINALRTPTCCDNLYNTGALGVNKLNTYSKTVAANFSQTAGKVWAAVSTFFSAVASKLGEALSVAKEYVGKGLVKAKDFAVALPREYKLAAGGVTLVGALTLAAFKFCKKSEAKAPVADEVVAKAAADAAPAADAKVVDVAPAADAKVAE